MISGHFSSFSCFMPILVLVEEVVRLFCAPYVLIMSLPARTNKTPLNHSGLRNCIAQVQIPGFRSATRGWISDMGIDGPTFVPESA